MYGMQEVSDYEFDDTIRHKIRIGSNSGYLDEEYQTTKEFPTISDYHFRIEDQHEIMELQKLRQRSSPINMTQSFKTSSDGFKSRLDALIDSLNRHQASFDNVYPAEKHGFYQLADSYDQNSAVEAVLQNVKTEELRQKVEDLSIKDVKPTFIKRKKKEEDSSEMKGETKNLCKKINRMTITEDDC